MKLEWHPLALADRNRIFDYIEENNPRAAIAVDERIQAEAGVLTRFPEGGRRGRVSGTRELVIANTPYIAAYQILPNSVIILRVLHHAQRWPDDLPAVNG